MGSGDEVTDRWDPVRTDMMPVRPQETLSRSPTPEAPPWSPITPTIKSTELSNLPHIGLLDHKPGERRNMRRGPSKIAEQGGTQGQVPSNSMSRQPEAVPISEDSNPDAIALRAALDLLQLQRERAIQDIQLLRDQKEKALANTEGFIRALTDGHFTVPSDEGVSPSSPGSTYRYCDQPTAAGHLTRGDGSAGTDMSSGGPCSSICDFEPMPQPQNVIRCPPVNWHKYQLDGQVLENVYRAQRDRPSAAVRNATRDATEVTGHVLAAPYMPFVDNA